jgi:hypothetical protein
MVKLVIPKYTLLLWRKNSIKELSKVPSFVLSEKLFSRGELLEKGEVLQELILQCLIGYFITFIGSASIYNNSQRIRQCNKFPVIAPD